jgi:FixJ family two-component response regulator
VLCTSPTVFVVDDDESVRESLELLVRNAGWQPVVCASGAEFLARPRVLEPSCLILDVALPDLDGFDLQKLIADRSDLPIIFLTAYCDVPMTVRAMKAGAVEFLTKHFDETRHNRRNALGAGFGAATREGHPPCNARAVTKMVVIAPGSYVAVYWYDQVSDKV